MNAPKASSFFVCFSFVPGPRWRLLSDAWQTEPSRCERVRVQRNLSDLYLHHFASFWHLCTRSSFPLLALLLYNCIGSFLVAFLASLSLCVSVSLSLSRSWSNIEMVKIPLGRILLSRTRNLDGALSFPLSFLFFSQSPMTELKSRPRLHTAFSQGPGKWTWPVLDTRGRIRTFFLLSLSRCLPFSLLLSLWLHFFHLVSSCARCILSPCIIASHSLLFLIH